jgi:hypothetical protein
MDDIITLFWSDFNYDKYIYGWAHNVVVGV